MKFFVPEVPDSHAEVAYTSLSDAAKSQMKTTIAPKRIYGLTYVHNKRQFGLVVGGPHPEHLGYMVVAILESQPYIVIAKSTRGGSGITILVNNTEVTEVTEFE
jgi:hypothetical protein